MKLKLVNKKLEATDTYSFYWEPKKRINYLPGQYFYFTLPKMDKPDYRGPTRDFTLSSSPTEGNLLRFTTRIRDESEFKQTLIKLQLGSFIEAEGPNGTFIVDEKEPGPHVFIAGGIGITPFRSIIKYQIDKKLSSKIILLYSNTTPDLISFEKELKSWTINNQNIKLVMTITQPDESLPAQTGKTKWSGLTGRINEKLIEKTSKGLKNPTYWIAGPPPMVTAMELLLQKLKIPSDKIRSDKFTGY
jgi:ferredoxin-NADP reductase